LSHALVLREGVYRPVAYQRVYTSQYVRCYNYLASNCITTVIPKKNQDR
jgi:hypothetical protein